jgi:N-acetyl-alpha-D-glucosaminyl L-malate synthase BshA
MLRDTGSNIRLITTLHGTDITIVGQDPSYAAITKFSIERSDALTAVSRYLREQTIDAFGCSGCSIDVIPNFVDPTVYDRTRYPPTAWHARTGHARPVLMHLSNFRPVKRVRDVVQIFARVRATMPCELVLVGDGPERVQAQDEAHVLGVEEDVSFLGKIDAVAPLLASADLFLLPSQTESFGLSALEALASGVPVIATNVGGIPEVVTHEETGFLFPVGDVEPMAAAAIELLRNRARWSAMSAAGAADARARFATDAIVPQYEALYARR